MYFVQDAHSFWNWIYFVVLIVVRKVFSVSTVYLVFYICKKSHVFFNSVVKFIRDSVVPPRYECGRC